MKLYYTPGVCSLAPHIVLRETNTPHTLVMTDIETDRKTEHGGDYRATNPLGYVPALELDDGTVLTELPAIVQYIADQAAASSLAPAHGSFERYKAQSWLGFVGMELHRNFTPLFNDAMPEVAKDLFRQRLALRLDYLNTHFAANDYLMGSNFTLPDAYAFVVLRWSDPQTIDLSPYPNVTSFMARVAARPAVQDAMKAEGLIH